MNTIKITTGVLLLALAISVAPGFAQAATLSRQLDLGATGSDVTTLQTFLASDSSLYPQGLVTGYFGSLTAAAVSRFQGRNGLAMVGRVGPLTLAALNAQLSNGTTGTGDAPTISNINMNTGSSSATITWNTNQGSSAVVYYSTSPLILTEGSAMTKANISGNSALETTNLNTTHSVTIGNLSSGTTYNYAILVQNGQGSVSVALPATFRTN